MTIAVEHAGHLLYQCVVLLFSVIHKKDTLANFACSLVRSSGLQMADKVCGPQTSRNSQHYGLHPGHRAVVERWCHWCQKVAVCTCKFVMLYSNCYVILWGIHEDIVI